MVKPKPRVLFTSIAELRDKQQQKSWPFSCQNFSLSQLQRARQIRLVKGKVRFGNERRGDGSVDKGDIQGLDVSETTDLSTR